MENLHPLSAPVKRVWPVIFIIALVCLVAGGLQRVTIDTNVLQLLPPQTPGIQEMRLLNGNLSDEHNVYILIESTSGDLADSEAELAQLVEMLGEVPETQRVYLNQGTPQDDSDSDLSKVLAYLWMNGPEGDFQQLIDEHLQPDALKERTLDAVNVISESLDPVEVFYATHDPVGLAVHPFMQWQAKVLEDLEKLSDTSRIVVVAGNPELMDYKDRQIWVSGLRAVIADFQADVDEGDSVRNWAFGISGSPAFSAEMGTAMEDDISGTAGLAGLLIILLFYLFQRSLRQLLAVGFCLAVTCVITLGLYGWFFSSMGLISAGFAAILMGLVVDYAMIISREIGACGSIQIALKNSWRGVTWAASTTAATFAVLMVSALPGGKQLGFLVSVGLLVGAIVMMVIYPKLAYGSSRPHLPPLPQVSLPRRRIASVLLGVSIIAVVVGLVFQTPAKVSFDLTELRPKNSEAHETWTRLESLIPSWGSQRVHVVADDGAEHWEKLEQQLSDMQSEGVVRNFYLPVSVLPNEESFRKNVQLYQSLDGEFDETLALALDEAGLTSGAGTLMREVAKYWESWRDRSSGEIFQEVQHDPILRSTIVESEGRSAVLGGVLLSRTLDRGLHQRVRDLDVPGVTFASWEMLRYDIMPLFRKDVTTVLMPMLVVLLLSIFIALRNVREAFVAISILVVGLLSSVLMITAINPEWHFLSIVGFPLLLGAGLDYTLHLTFSYRRESGNTAAVFRSTGLAVIFCTLSTTIGFVSLIFASNDAIADLGIVVSVGILILAGYAVFILPGLLPNKGYSPGNSSK